MLTLSVMWMIKRKWLLQLVQLLILIIHNLPQMWQEIHHSHQQSMRVKAQLGWVCSTCSLQKTLHFKTFGILRFDYSLHLKTRWLCVWWLQLRDGEFYCWVWSCLFRTAVGSLCLAVSSRNRKSLSTLCNSWLEEQRSANFIDISESSCPLLECWSIYMHLCDHTPHTGRLLTFQAVWVGYQSTLMDVHLTSKERSYPVES